MAQLKILLYNLDTFRKTEGSESYWFARDIYENLGYSDWDEFRRTALERAIESCKTGGDDIFYHFSKLLRPDGSEDWKLTRYACYLVAQNGNTDLPETAFAQKYFASKTRSQEVLEQHIEDLERMISRKKLGESEQEFAKVAFEHGVDGKGFAAIRSAGDRAMFGYGTDEMKARMGIPAGSKTPLADVLSSVVLSAKELATRMTTVNTKKKNLHGTAPIKMEHIQNNQGVSHLLKRQGIDPTELPPGEDIKKVKERHEKENEPHTKNLLD